MNAKVIVLCLFMICCTSLVYAQFAGGDGTESSPWQISTAEHLDSIRNYIGEENSDKHFILINDIDLDVPPYNSGEGWLPFGNASNQFKGYFDGDGHTIMNLFINRPSTWYISLFGYVGNTGVVTDLHLENVDVTGYSLVAGLVGNNVGYIVNCSVGGNIMGSGSGVGGIAGENNLGTIENCCSYGLVTGMGNNAGGLVGRNRLNSTIIGSYSSCNITGSGNNSYGGLVGWNDCIITDSYATGNVNGIMYCGGLVGRNYQGAITNCYATGDVSGSQNWIGGLVGGNAGLNDASISNSYSTGNVGGDSAVGGLVGENENHGVISNCYALGEVWGSNAAPYLSGVGGLIGKHSSGAIVEYSYSIGQVSGNPPMGGLIGYNTGGMVISSYWNIDTSNQNSSAGGIGLTIQQMVQEESFDMWDFDEIWQIVEMITYPYLQDNPQDPPPSPFPSPINLHVDTQTGLFTWDAPELRKNYIMEYLDQKRLELIEYNVYLDGDFIASTEDTSYQYEGLIVNQQYVAGVQAVYDYGLSAIVTQEFTFEGPENVGTPVSSKITRLYGNYPNPVNNETKIIFSLKKTEKVTIKVYNLKGALVRTLIDGYINEGAHNILWDGKTDNGIGASSGIYFIRMETPDYRETKKTMLIK